MTRIGSNNLSIISSSKWIAQLESTCTSTEESQAFKECKKALKNLAKADRLSESERTSILSILSEKKLRQHPAGSAWGNVTFSTTRLLFFSPRLWKYLTSSSEYPNEASLIHTLRPEEYSCLLNNFDQKQLEPVDIDTLVKILHIVTLLKIPELEKFYLNAVTNNTQLISNIGTLYHLSSLNISKLCSSTLWACLDRTPQAMAKEFNFFRQMLSETAEKKWETLSPLELCRFFLFVQSNVTPSQRFDTLRIELLGKLLNSLKNGTLKKECCEHLIEEANHSLELRELIKKDDLLIKLENGSVLTVSFWLLFQKSEYFRKLAMPGMQLLKEVKLDGYASKSFLAFYDLWGKNESIDFSSLSIEQLIDLLGGASFFVVDDFDDAREKIVEAIIEQCDMEPNSLAVLAEIANQVHCPQLEEAVVAWLNKQGICDITKDRNRYTLTMHVTRPPSYEALQSTVKVLRIMHFNRRFSKINMFRDTPYPATAEIYVPDAWILSLLSRIYCCDQLNLEKEKEAIETEDYLCDQLRSQATAVRPYEQYPYWTEPIPWNPYHVFKIIHGMSEKASAPFLYQLKTEHFDSSFLRALQRHARTIGEGDFAHFTHLETYPAEISNLSAEELLSLLVFLMREDTVVPLKKADPLLKNLSLAISKQLKANNLTCEQLKNILEECKKYHPENAEVINHLLIEIDYPNTSATLSIPILLLTQSKDLLTKGKLGDPYKEIPIESTNWAIEVLSKVASPLLSSNEASSIPPTHFKALELLQRNILSLKDILTVRAEELIELADFFQEETLPAVASWAASVGNSDLVKTCCKLYCPETFEYTKMLLYPPNLWHEFYSLYFFEPRALKMLKSVGSHIRILDLELKQDQDEKVLNFKDTQGSSNLWNTIFEACPNATNLWLDLKGSYPSLKSASLAKLQKLNTVTIQTNDTEAMGSLSELQIPEGIKVVVIDTEPGKITKDYLQFLRHLPSRRINIQADPKSLNSGYSFWNFVPGFTPTSYLCSSLKHCKEIEFSNGNGNDFIPYIIAYNQNLEILELNYLENCPSVDDIKNLIKRMPNLIKLGLDIRPLKQQRETSTELEHFLENWNKGDKTPKIKYRIL